MLEANGGCLSFSAVYKTYHRGLEAHAIGIFVSRHIDQNYDSVETGTQDLKY